MHLQTLHICINIVHNHLLLLLLLGRPTAEVHARIIHVHCPCRCRLRWLNIIYCRPLLRLRNKLNKLTTCSPTNLITHYSFMTSTSHLWSDIYLTKATQSQLSFDCNLLCNILISTVISVLYRRVSISSKLYKIAICP